MAYTDDKSEREWRSENPWHGYARTAALILATFAVAGVLALILLPYESPVHSLAGVLHVSMQLIVVAGYIAPGHDHFRAFILLWAWAAAVGAITAATLAVDDTRTDLALVISIACIESVALTALTMLAYRDGGDMLQRVFCPRTYNRVDEGDTESDTDSGRRDKRENARGKHGKRARASAAHVLAHAEYDSDSGGEACASDHGTAPSTGSRDTAPEPGPTAALLQSAELEDVTRRGRTPSPARTPARQSGRKRKARTEKSASVPAPAAARSTVF